MIKLKEVGNYLKSIRNSLDLSLKNVNQKTGITDSRLSRIEKGNVNPDPTTLKLLANLYKIDLIDLYLQYGYLDDIDLSSYKKVFSFSELLTDDERNHIQNEIYLFTKGRK